MDRADWARHLEERGPERGMVPRKVGSSVVLRVMLKVVAYVLVERTDIAKVAVKDFVTVQAKIVDR